MQDIILVRFARKPTGIDDIKAVAGNPDYHAEDVEIIETRQLSPWEYDDFVANLFDDRDWLAGKGGFKDRIRQAVEVTAPLRDTLYVDPSGHAYARYVGMRIDSVTGERIQA